MKPTCSTCAHWDQTDDDPPWSTCAAMVDRSDGGGQNDGDPPAYISAYYGPAFHCRADFGCVLHEPREETP